MPPGISLSLASATGQGSIGTASMYSADLIGGLNAAALRTQMILTVLRPKPGFGDVAAARRRPSEPGISRRTRTPILWTLPGIVPETAAFTGARLSAAAVTGTRTARSHREEVHQQFANLSVVPDT